ncbi:MAG: haloacid dehalogenase-like hydrolase, partial [Patescibacteria group bacterium]
AITGSPDIVARPFTALWGFDQRFVFSSTAEITDGQFTGRRLIRPHEDGKDQFIDQCLTLLPGSTLAHSIGVGDTEGDISLLERVAYPIAFNPNFALAQVARKHGWRMVIERKDAIWVNGELLA